MKRIVIALAIAVLAACGGGEKASASNAAKPASVAGEKIYPLEGKIVGRDAAENSLKLDHKEIAGYMEAMTMDYIVRGEKIEALPANGAQVTAKLHVTDEHGMWITDVKQIR